MIKLGEQGIYVRSAAGSFELEAPPVAVVEPSGAGDAFAAGLAVGILEGLGARGDGAVRERHRRLRLLRARLRGGDLHSRARRTRSSPSIRSACRRRERA